MGNLKISLFPLVFCVFLMGANTCTKKDTPPNPNTGIPDGLQTETVKDFDGNEYHVVKIGTQYWTVENLRTTHYEDGSGIPYIKDNNAWTNATSAGYCNYKDSIENAPIYGHLYNGYFSTVGSALNPAPDGWHLATDSDWTVLTDYLGGQAEAGNHLKEGGNAHWWLPNTNATDKYHFTALPGGFRRPTDGAYFYKGQIGYWWGDTNESGQRWVRNMATDVANVDRYLYSKNSGFSLRCVKNK